MARGNRSDASLCCCNRTSLALRSFPGMDDSVGGMIRRVTEKTRRQEQVAPAQKMKGMTGKDLKIMHSFLSFGLQCSFNAKCGQVRLRELGRSLWSRAKFGSALYFVLGSLPQPPASSCIEMQEVNSQSRSCLGFR
jgi:hypothetical protein